MVAFRTVECLAFFDESGQGRAPRPGEPAEILTVGAFVTSAPPEELAAVADLVGKIRGLHSARHGPATKYDASGLAESDLVLIADALRGRSEWKFAYFPMSIEGCDPAEFRAMMGDYASAVQAKIADLRGSAALDLRPQFAVARIQAMSDANLAYLFLWFKVVLEVCRWLRASGILPVMHAIIDRRPSLEDEDALELVGRMAHGTTFPEAYADRLGELLGVRPTVGFQASIRGDEGTDGLVVADLITYAAGRVFRSQDPVGTFGRFLARVDSDYRSTT